MSSDIYIYIYIYISCLILVTGKTRVKGDKRKEMQSLRGADWFPFVFSKNGSGSLYIP